MVRPEGGAALVGEILVVADSPVDVGALIAILREPGHAVRVAADAIS